MPSKKISAIHAHTTLEKAVLRWINRRASDYDNGWKGATKDLFHGGCSSGIVSELIYNKDCDRFARRHLSDILALMEEYCDNMGEAPTPNRRDGMQFDTTWLAWSGFEMAAHNVVNRAEQDEDIASDTTGED